MLVDFLKTQRSKEDLKIALDVLREFKGELKTGPLLRASLEPLSGSGGLR